MSAARATPSNAARTTSFPSYPPTAPELIAWCARTHGDHPFVILGDEHLTYAEADARSAALARALLASGVGKGSHVGLLAPNSPSWVVAWLAASRIGAVVALLNTYSKTRALAWVLRHADVSLLLTVPGYLAHDYVERLEAGLAGLRDAPAEQLFLPDAPFLRSVWTWGDVQRSWARPVAQLLERSERVDEDLLRAAEAEVTPADPMIIVYSSGSTAAPKGVVHSHGAVVRHAHNLWQFRDVRPTDILYTPMPLFWVGGLSFTLLGAMHAGATLVFEDHFEPAATLEILERERVTQVLGWPHMAKALVDDPSFASRDLSAVRGGTLAALQPRSERHASAPRANSLGMTETLGPHTIEGGDPLPPAKKGSFGRAVPGMEHKVVDPQTGRECAAGEVGELWLRGYALMAGLHKVERTATFTPDGWLRTGDSGHFDADGHFYYRGRLGELIKASGMNVTPRDVEVELESLGGVAMAYVTGVDHPTRGQDVVAAVALKPGATLTAEEIRAAVKERIASYLVPRQVLVFTDQADLPWLESGKIDRRALTKILADEFATAG